MTEARDHERSAPRSEDARDLQLRLYREIGIAAVAAALCVGAAERPGSGSRDMAKAAIAPYRKTSLAA